MDSISTFFKEENDSLLYWGEVKGLEKGREEGRDETREGIISNLFEKLGLSDEQVSSVANAPLKLVQKMRKKLQK